MESLDVVEMSGQIKPQTRDPAGKEGACVGLKVNPLLASVALNMI